MQNWKLVDRKNIYNQGRLKFDQFGYELPDGKRKDYIVRDIGNVAKVFAVTAERKAILIEQFRVGPQETVFELPGGFCDKKERPEITAGRELLEETGYTGEIEYLTSFWNDAYSTMKIYCYLAKNCQKISDQKLDDDEYIDIHLVSVDALRKKLFEGQMRDIGICYLGLDRLGWM